MESIEKLLGYKLTEEPVEKEESFILQAKQALLAGGPPTDQAQKL